MQVKSTFSLWFCFRSGGLFIYNFALDHKMSGVVCFPNAAAFYSASVSGHHAVRWSFSSWSRLWPPPILMVVFSLVPFLAAKRFDAPDGVFPPGSVPCHQAVRWSFSSWFRSWPPSGQMEFFFLVPFLAAKRSDGVFLPGSVPVPGRQALTWSFSSWFRFWSLDGQREFGS
jgi:hypothetical protein